MCLDPRGQGSFGKGLPATSVPRDNERQIPAWPAYQGKNRRHIHDAFIDGLVQTPVTNPPRQPPNVQLERPALDKAVASSGGNLQRMTIVSKGDVNHDSKTAYLAGVLVP